MMKNAILILLLAASLSFAAKPPIPPIDTGMLYGKVFLNSVCTYNMMAYLLYEAQSGYYVYDGKSCVHPDLNAQSALVVEALYGDGSPSLIDLYRAVTLACGEDARSQECSDAKYAFYLGAHSSRSIFSGAKAAYMQAAGQALLAARKPYDCGTTRGDITEDMQAAYILFHECMLGPSVR